MVTVAEEITIDAPADEVWAVVAAPERQAEWFPGMKTSSVDGNVRTIGTAAGGMLLEEILCIDHERRRFEYRITGPMQFEHHLGSIEVEDVGGATRVVYGQELEPTALTYVLGAAIRDALIGLKALLETGTTSRGWDPGEAAS
ncbi:MAG: SRPBCC family protein [Actinobacteria bacterium]|nr:SRPBCC family protein [Actinomycetota bacterium]